MTRRKKKSFFVEEVFVEKGYLLNCFTNGVTLLCLLLKNCIRGWGMLAKNFGLLLRYFKNIKIIDLFYSIVGVVSTEGCMGEHH